MNIINKGRMKREEIIQKLREATGNKSINLPSLIEFGIENKTLTISLPSKCVCANMQTNESAFEGWAICLKAWLSDLIEKVFICWEPLNKGDLHYERFLYRVWKFTRTYDWAENGSIFTLEYYKDNLKYWVVNFPCNDANESPENEESILEGKYLTKHKDTYDVINQQLPVGIFKENIGKDKCVLPSGKSQIDIWSIKDDTLFIFELKKKDNMMVGIISELMFYVNIMNEIKHERIKYPNEASKSTHRDFDKLYNAFFNGAIKRIKGIFLTDQLHPLISEDVINLMNDSYLLRKENISYSYKPYSK